MNRSPPPARNIQVEVHKTASYSYKNPVLFNYNLPVESWSEESRGPCTCRGKLKVKKLPEKKIKKILFAGKNI